ncbi:MAG: AAA family ATPase [Candidatus Peribacteraceae bacterium]|nr:AAA family ATPase [Candidatus Peribacteraceae bacterium]MDP7454328.1 AAA family ATPase [Candidatus Peribacteraceae bacterium]MDP7645726.1 AAA family ATPase [Candidatus Peribacteraceae bacterium]
MNQKPLDITGTHLATGRALMKILYGYIAFLVYVIIVALMGVMFWLTGGLPPLAIACALLFFPIVAFHMFLEQAFLRRGKKVRWNTHEAEHLSYALVRRFPDMSKITLLDLVQASITSPIGRFIVKEMGKDPDEFLKRATLLVEAAEVTDIEKFVKEGYKAMKEWGRSRIDSGVILALLFRDEQGFREELFESDLEFNDVLAILKWESFHRKFEDKVPFWSTKGLLRTFGGVGRSWVMGYTDELDRLTDDLSEHVLWSAERHVRIHEDEQKQAIRIINKSNLHDLLIMGPVGVGKKTLVENIAYSIRKHERDESKAYSRVLMLKTAELLSGTANPDAFLLHALNDAKKSGRFILVIQDLALMLKSGGENIRGILSKFIREKAVQLIGIISTEDYHSYLKNDPSLDQYFEKMIIEEPSEEETVYVLMEHTFRLQKEIGVQVTYSALKSIKRLSERYLAGMSFPGKAVSVLEDAMLLAKDKKDKFVKESHIREIISQKGRVDVTEMDKDDKKRVLNLGNSLRKRIVGQTRAIDALTGTLKRAALEIHEGTRPLGTFLFLGSTGIGKTHTAKILADEYFGSADSMIRLDMNEYSTPDSVAGITGGGDVSFLARQVHDKPFSLILMDEIEKAHLNVLNLFLQILDEGLLIDHSGGKTDFRNTIIIATSNAGALFVRDAAIKGTKVDTDEFKQSMIDHILKAGAFSPEFMNRFDEVILFNPLSKEEAKQVAILMLDSIVREMKEKRGITLKLDEEVLNDLVEKGYSAEFGAREMRRTIVDTIENRLADYMLENEVKRGEEIVLKKDEDGS